MLNIGESRECTGVMLDSNLLSTAFGANTRSGKSDTYGDTVSVNIKRTSLRERRQ